MNRLRLFLRAALDVVLCAALTQGVAAAEPELTVVAGGRMATYAPASLLALPAATNVTIPVDVAYKREMTFRAVPVASLLAGVGPDETIRFVANDGYVANLAAAPLLARNHLGRLRIHGRRLAASLRTNCRDKRQRGNRACNDPGIPGH